MVMVFWSVDICGDLDLNFSVPLKTVCMCVLCSVAYLLKKTWMKFIEMTGFIVYSVEYKHIYDQL